MCVCTQKGIAHTPHPLHPAVLRSVEGWQLALCRIEVEDDGLEAKAHELHSSHPMIADALVICLATLKAQISNLLSKLQVSSWADAIAFAIKSKLVAL